ncbi:MAG: tRNA pseudouridine(54/55) synthase Pus10 [Candidatus Thermoplasmatota archaeon]|nr:tRNA pseudouridine(54/55) synthase Pus10 [Candidatus Thermoplasmatota archaeon]
MSSTLQDKDIVAQAQHALSMHQLCDYCLGRLFAKLESGMSNKSRGKKLRAACKQSTKTLVRDCWLCQGLFDELPSFTTLIIHVLEPYEFDTFLIGSKIDEDTIERETSLWEEVGNEHAEPIKVEINRELGKVLETQLHKEVDFEDPTVMVILDTAFDVVTLQIKSLFIYGRYKKYARTIPQTKWFCKVCRGKGCRRCNYTGALYDTSVQELIATSVLEATGGIDNAFHGCGREDIDARMLGNGRPFVLEIKHPKKRSVNLAEIEQNINTINKGSIEVQHLRFSDRDEIARIKNAAFQKTYRVTIQSEKPLSNEKLKKVTAALRNRAIGQLTPSRVAHRRANMVREKQIYGCSVESVDGTISILTIEAESGTYIKELVSGDDGRTTPNLSELIGIPCRVTALDVIEIKGE